MRKVLLLAGLLAAGCAPAARAQEHPLEVGQRIRVLAPGAGLIDRTAATVIGVWPDSVTIQIHSLQRTLPRASLTALEISRGRGSRTKYGGVGVLLGTGAGAFVAALHRVYTPAEEVVVGYEERCTLLSCAEVPILRRKPYPAAATLGIVAAGALAGGVAGALLPADRWEAVPVRVGIVRHPEGFRGAVLLSVRR